MSRDRITVLLIDIEPSLLQDLSKEAKVLGVATDTSTNLSTALERHAREPVDVVLLRDCLNEEGAADVILQLQATESPPEIIVYSDQGDDLNAETALKAGIWDYVVNPDLKGYLPQILRRAIKYRQQQSQGNHSKQTSYAKSLLNKYGIIGTSSALQNCIDVTARIAQSNANILIFGESGTGKELFASAIHALSDRGKKEMTIVDCTTLPSTLVESILFGHTKGAFTGASIAQQGLVEQAHGSTLFLDEIGEMPLAVQKKLLRVIQERTFLPVGSTTERSSDFRLIAATNRDLEKMAAEGHFREDLLFRLKTFYLELPPLRTRKSDITELVYHYRDLYCEKNKLRKKRFSPDYLMVLRRYDWPGNVRELFQAIERSLADAQEETLLHPKHLPPEIRIAVAKKRMQRLSKDNASTRSHPSAAMTTPADFTAEMTLKKAREQAIAAREKSYLEALMKHHNGNIKACCTTAGVSRSRFYALLSKYDLNQPN